MIFVNHFLSLRARYSRSRWGLSTNKNLYQYARNSHENLLNDFIDLRKTKSRADGKRFLLIFSFSFFIFSSKAQTVDLVSCARARSCTLLIKSSPTAVVSLTVLYRNGKFHPRRKTNHQCDIQRSSNLCAERFEKYFVNFQFWVS